MSGGEIIHEDYRDIVLGSLFPLYFIPLHVTANFPELLCCAGCHQGRAEDKADAS